MKRTLPLILFSSAFLLASCGEGPASSDSTPPVEETSSSVAEDIPSLSESSDLKEDPSSSSSVVAQGGVLYIAPDGTSSGDGTETSPLSFIDGIKASKPGDTLYLLGGTYRSLSTLFVTKDKTHEAYNDYFDVKDESGRRTITPAIHDGKEDKVLFDFSGMSFYSSNRGITLNSDYWTLRNVEVQGAGDNGVYIGGNHNICEGLKIHDCQDTGLQLGRRSSKDNSIAQWPSYNLIKNCTSYDNHDPSGEDSDGFACKLTTGVGNVFDGCIAYNNVDDGWDLYTKGESGPIGPVTIQNCIAFNNGITSQGVGTANSDGNGFKLGGENIAVPHIVKNSIAFHNLATGFTDNSNPGTLRIENCTSFNNGTRDLDANNFDLCRDTKTSANLYKNLLSYCEGERISPITLTSAKANSRDQYKGAASHCLFYRGLSFLYIKDVTDVDYSSSAKAGELYREPNGKVPFQSVASPQRQSSKGVPSPDSTNIHALWRDENGDIALGDFLKVNPDSAFFSMGEEGTPLGANLAGGQSK